MKAIRVEELGGPEVLRLAEVPVPRVETGQVLVAIRAAGVNPVEAYTRAGLHGKKVTLPYTPGTDGAGLVVESAASGWSVGARVYVTGSLTGTYAEKAVCAGEDVHLLPEGVDFAAGAALGIPYATAYRALFQRGELREEETVLIHGASGGVGTAAVQLAVGSGHRVFGTAGSLAGREMVGRLGAERAFDHGDSGYREEILAASGGRGVDVLLEMLANVNLDEDLRLLAPRGRVVVIGSRGRIEIDPRDAMVREADIRGMMLALAPPPEREQIYRALGEKLRAGSIRPIIDRQLPLSAATEAHCRVMEGESHGKVILFPSGAP